MTRPPRPEEFFESFDWSPAHRAPIQMRYADLDTMGHLNNAVYVQYFETARAQLFEALALSAQTDRSVIARLEIDYRREVRWGQSVLVETLVEGLGRSSWTAIARLSADGVPCAYARTVQVRVAEDALQPTELGEELRARLQRYLGQRAP